MTRKCRAVDVVTVLVGVLTAVVAPAGLVGAGMFAVLIVLGIVALDGEPDGVGRWAHAVLTVFSVWSLMASLLFTGSAQGWLVLAGGVGVAAIGLAGLVAGAARPRRDVRLRAVVPGVTAL